MPSPKKEQLKRRDQRLERPLGGNFASIFVAVAFLGCAATPPSGAADPISETAPPPVLEAETSGTLTLPPAGPHRLYLASGRGYTIVDGTEAKVEGHIYGGYGSVLAVSPDNSKFFVAESYWSKGNRGKREDLVSIYDASTIELIDEVKLPGRLIAGGRMPYFSISADGRTGFVFNVEPATSVQIVDLEKGKYRSNIEIPGCGLIYPYKNEGFASLCADGSLLTVEVNARGKGVLKQSEPFFDAEADPVFEESLVDRESGEALFITYSGKVIPVTLGETPEFGESWSIQETADMAPGRPDVQQETWRPGGRRPFALHTATNTLFVLMHKGKHWTQKEHGSEVWAIDTATHHLKGRYQLPTAGRVIGVSQDDAPQLYVAGDGNWLWIMDPETGKITKQMDEISRAHMIQVTGF